VLLGEIVEDYVSEDGHDHSREGQCGVGRRTLRHGGDSRRLVPGHPEHASRLAEVDSFEIQVLFGPEHEKRAGGWKRRQLGKLSEVEAGDERQGPAMPVARPFRIGRQFRFAPDPRPRCRVVELEQDYTVTDELHDRHDHVGRQALGGQALAQCGALDGGIRPLQGEITE